MKIETRKFLVEPEELWYAEKILNRIAKYIRKTYAERKNMHQRFRTYFAGNLRLKDIESTSWTA